MYVAPQRKRQAVPPTAFLTTNNDLRSDFKKGECQCKSCESLKLDFSDYLDDAKCEDCGQWQNESLRPENH